MPCHLEREMQNKVSREVFFFSHRLEDPFSSLYLEDVSHFSAKPSPPLDLATPES